MFELTIHKMIGMIGIGIWQRFQRDFELTMFELTVPDLYMVVGTLSLTQKVKPVDAVRSGCSMQQNSSI